MLNLRLIALGLSGFATLCLPIGAFAASADKAQLVLKIAPIKSHEGKVLISLFNQEKGFPSKSARAVRSLKVKPEHDRMEVILEDLKPGKYAVAVFHDENDNGKLDSTKIGVPKESFGFSGNPKVMGGPPSFEKAQFEISKERAEQEIEMKSF